MHMLEDARGAELADAGLETSSNTFIALLWLLHWTTRTALYNYIHTTTRSAAAVGNAVPIVEVVFKFSKY